MNRYRVLVPLDGSSFSRSALPAVRRLLRPADPLVVLLHVITRPEQVGEGSDPRSLDGWASIQRWIDGNPVRAEAVPGVSDLGTAQGTLEAAGFSVGVALRFGDPVVRIGELIDEWGIDLVVMATHGRTALPRLVMGSVAEQVLRSVSVPVMMVRPDKGLAPEKLPQVAKRAIPSVD